MDIIKVKKRGDFLKKMKIDWFLVVVFCALIARLTNTLTVNYVSGTSMYPTLKERSLVFGSNIEVKQGNIDYKDIIVVEVGDKMLIKRVVACPGDTVKIEENVLYVNNEIIEEEYAFWTYESVLIDVEETVLSDTEFFVLGDNRNFSRDSRDFGPIDIKDVVSKIYFVN